MDLSTSTKVYRVLIFRTAGDIVQHSSKVWNSISHLNLELCQSYMPFDKFKNHSKNLILTNERASGRKSQHSNSPKDKRSLERQGIITKIDRFSINILCSLVDYVCRETDHGLKILKWLINFHVSGTPDMHWLPFKIVEHFIDYLHPGQDDPEFVMDCFRKLNLMGWLNGETSRTPERMTNLLCQFNRTGRNADHLKFITTLIDQCIIDRSFRCITAVLKFQDTPRFCLRYGRAYAPAISDVRGSFSSRRQTLLRYLLHIYLPQFNNAPAAWEFVRLFWNSIPDSFLSTDEIAKALQTGVCASISADICCFYSKAVGELRSYVEPRSLMHYSRIVIRRSLDYNKQWLPDGIKEIGLPKKLQWYLNLEDSGGSSP